MRNKISNKYELYQDDLLLHSMANYTHQISIIMDVLKPKSICEVGIEGGKFTQYLLDYTKKFNAQYIGIEPEISQVIKTTILEYNQKIYESLSLDVLGKIDADIYFLDGDHNYYTLYNELRLIFGSKKNAFVFMHDISWPWRERDLYYNPIDIPTEYLHEYESKRGIKLGDRGTVEHGFRSLGQYSFASIEGGDKNGLLAAIHDFISEDTSNSYEYLELFAIFGLGIIYQKDSLTHQASEMLDFVQDSFNYINPLLINMESNRLELLNQNWEFGEYVKFLEKEITQNKQIIDEKMEENFQKNSQIKKLKREVEEALHTIRSIQNSKAWKLIEMYRKFKVSIIEKFGIRNDK